MLALISFILVIIGAVNWFCIGLLQFDFVAGLFGSQSSIFSRIIYIAVGVGALMLLYNLIENKGQIKFNFKKKLKELTDEKEVEKRKSTYFAYPKTSSQEASEDNHINKPENQHSYNTESSIDSSLDNSEDEATNKSDNHLTD
ncbi:MAG: DUF378 domain-containing protein [Clostridia bacterium]|nr:DUF378 domain-containing protein [Clostridia bacterium]